MADPHVVTALVRKRAELAGEIAALDRQTEAVLARIAHVDECLALFGFNGDPNDIAPIHPQHGRAFKRGQLQRLVLDVTREANGLLSYREIAERIIQRLDWDQDDRDLLASLTVRVRHTMKRLRRRSALPSPED